MQFEINNRHWVIEETEEKYIIDILQSQEEDGVRIIMANGLTDFQKQIIYINKDLHEEVKKETLYHELMHCYLRSYTFFPTLERLSEEMLCDLSANSHDIIHKIAEDYFKGGKRCTRK